MNLPGQRLALLPATPAVFMPTAQRCAMSTEPRLATVPPGPDFQSKCAMAFSLILHCARFSRWLLQLQLLEAAPAQHRPALSGFERNRSLRPAHRTGNTSLGTDPLAPPRAFCFALLAALGVVLELFVVEEELLSCRKNKVGAAVDALKYSIREFHDRFPRNREVHRNRPWLIDVPVPVPCFRS